MAGTFGNCTNLKETTVIPSSVTSKELSALNDLLSEEELLIKKFQMLAEHSSDAQVKAKFNDISNKHKEHFKSLYSQLS